MSEPPDASLPSNLGGRIAALRGDLGWTQTELAERVPGFEEGLTRIAHTCATWDGTTDPVRILTREGYRLP